MKKKLMNVMLLIACVSLFSFKQVCRGNVEEGFKKELQGKITPVVSNKDWNLSPIYNFLAI